MSGPDRGYAWVVAGACFCVNFLLVGLARSVAMLYVALVEQYGVSRQQATLPFSIRVSLKNLAGPLIGLLGQRYGIRRVCGAGGFVAAVGCLLCTFAPSVTWITVLWGIVHGVGFGMANVIHMLIINQYFDKYRATALGLAYSGDCFGTFAFPVILEHLLETYNVQGTFLILSGILLNIVPMAMLLKKPPWHQKSETARKEVQNNSDEVARRSVGYRNESFLKFDEDLSPFQTLDDDYCTYNAAYGPLRLTDVHKNSLSVWSDSASSISGSINIHRKTSGTSTHRNDSLIPVYEKELVIDPLEASDVSLKDHEKIKAVTLDSRDHKEDNVTRKRGSSSVSQIALEILHKVRSASFASQVAQDGFISNLSRTTSEINLEPAPRKRLSKDSLKNDSSSDIQIYSINTEKEHALSTGKSTSNGLKSGPLTDNVFFRKNSGPQHELPQNQSSNNDPASGTVIFSRKGGNEIIMTVQQIKFSDPNYLALSQQGLAPLQKNPPSILKLLIQTNLKPIFFLISMTMAVFAYCFIGVGIILIDYAGDQGIPHHQAKFLVIGFSATDLIGRLVFGQVIDRELVKMKNYVSVILLVMGILAACLPLNGSFNYMMACMCLFGASVGGAAIMYPILVNQYMDKGEESVAMGSLNFYGGILALSMAPMIGHFRDNVGSYNGVFYIFGGLVVLVGILWQFEPLILKWQNRPRKNQDRLVVTRL